jgi:DNA polymerase III gamma/tau subunit
VAGEPEGQTSPAARRSAAALAGGSARRALRLLEGEQLATIQRTVTILLRAADSPGVVDLFEAAAEAGKDRLEVAEALDVLRTWLRDLLLVREGVDDRHLINSEHLPQLRADAARLDHRAILRRLRAVDEAQVALRGNVQPALALENLALRMRVAP